MADVELLAKAILTYRHIFKTTKDLDPWRYVTLPSMCKDMFLNKYLPKDTIVGNGGSKPISQVCREWLIHIEAQDIIPEVPLTVNNIPDADYFKMFGGNTKRYYKKLCHTFTADAFNRKTKTIKEFQGCYYHGCPKCNPERKERYLQTCERKLILEQAGYKVEEMWECDWLAIKNTLANRKEIEAAAKAQNINIRDALFGGRTEGFKSYVKCVGKQVINYDDVTSLYPTVNALDDYAVGFKKYVTLTPKEILSGKFFGLAKVDVTPPEGLYVPVLPESLDGKLLFHLNGMTGTWFSVELKRAMEAGCVITKIHAALQYDKFNGLMKDYVGDFIQMKIENEKELTQEECDTINKYHHNLGFKFVIKPENCKNNSGLRQVAKICLNSLWGKFGQRTNLSSYDFINEYTVFVRNLHDPKIECESWNVINENCVESATFLKKLLHSNPSSFRKSQL